MGKWFKENYKEGDPSFDIWVPARGAIYKILRRFWERSEVMGNNGGVGENGSQAKKYREFRETEKGKEWKAPKFAVMSIAMDPKKHKKGQ